MRILFLNFCLILALLLPGCSGRDPSFALELADKIIIDESQLVLQHIPLQVEMIDESSMAMLNKSELCLYDTRSGKLLKRFDNSSLNGDSLVRATIGVEQADSITILPPDTTGPEPLVQVRSFDHADGEYLIYVYVAYSYRYRSDERAQLEIKKLKLKLSDTAEAPILTVDGAAPFFILTDKNFSIKRIISEQPSLGSRYGTYKIFPDMGFHRRRDEIVLRIYDQPAAFQLPPDQKITQRDSLPMVGLAQIADKKISLKKELLNTSAIPGYSYSSPEYGFSMRHYDLHNDTLLVSTEAGIFSLPGGKRFRMQRKLEANEKPRGPFKIYKERLLYCAGTDADKGKTSTIKILDPRSGELEFQLPVSSSQFAVQGDTLLLVGRDAEHYYIERYAIVEN